MPYLPSIFALIAANLVPLAGVLFFGWDVFAILFLYWLESAVVGFYNALKLKKAAMPNTSAETSELAGYLSNGKSPVGLQGAALVRFFLGHYGGFMAGHAFFLGIFWFAFTQGGVRQSHYTPPVFTSASALMMLASFASLMGSHGVSYVVNFIGKQEFVRISPARQMAQPYRRIFVMHIAIIGGGFLLIVTLGSPLAFLIAMILTKIFIDIFYHLKEHKQLAPYGAGGLPQTPGAAVMP